MQVTLRDVAARAGLSVSAVSQALRNQPRIPVETRERVRRIADDLGYRPLVAFAALGQRRAARPASMAMLNVAVIAARPERLHRRPELEAIRAEFESRGYNVSLLSTAMLGASPRRRLGHRGIVGCVVIEPALIRFSLENELADVSAAILGGSDHRLPFNVVRGHYFHASREAVRRLVAAGYRRIGLAPARHSPRSPTTMNASAAPFPNSGRCKEPAPKSRPTSVRSWTNPPTPRGA